MRTQMFSNETIIYFELACTIIDFKIDQAYAKNLLLSE